MKNRLVLRIFMLLSIVIVISGIRCICVNAGNYQDTEYYFQYFGDGSDVVTNARLKKDDTSAYAYNKSSHCAHIISVFSTNDSDNRPWLSSDKPGKPRNCSANGSSYTVAISQARYLPNYVYEWGYTYAYLVIEPQLHNSCTVKGLWSPDSI